jgi:hypothetical protein
VGVADVRGDRQAIRKTTSSVIFVLLVIAEAV